MTRSQRPPELTDRYTLNRTLEAMQQNLNWSVDGYRCQEDDLLRIMVAAAAKHTTIESVCGDAQNAPHSNMVRGHLKEQMKLEQITEYEQRWSEILAEKISSIAPTPGKR